MIKYKSSKKNHYWLVRRAKRWFDSGKSTPDAMATRTPIAIARNNDKTLGWNNSVPLLGIIVKQAPVMILIIAIH